MSFLVRVRRPFTTRLVRVRTLTTTAPEAFLERLESHPGVACLSLNRPHVKNAISFGLMKVNEMVLQRHIS
jgi:methylglutaconyl-CoA hydratase